MVIFFIKSWKNLSKYAVEIKDNMLIFKLKNKWNKKTNVNNF